MVPCPHCGAPLFGSMVSRCYKCHREVSVQDESPEMAARRAAADEAKRKKRMDPKLRRRFAPLLEALESGRAVVVADDRIGEEEEGWNLFVDSVLEKPYTCLRCDACGFTVVREFTPALDASWIVRNDGTASAENWKAFFACSKCGRDHRGKRVCVSHDSESALGPTTADPIAEAFGRPKRSWWPFRG